MRFFFAKCHMVERNRNTDYNDDLQFKRVLGWWRSRSQQDPACPFHAQAGKEMTSIAEHELALFVDGELNVSGTVVHCVYWLTCSFKNQMVNIACQTPKGVSFLIWTFCSFHQQCGILMVIQT